MKSSKIIVILFALGGCVDDASELRTSAVQVFECEDPKVAICHLPPGNPENPQSLCIAAAALPAHFEEHDGDSFGECEVAPPPEEEAPDAGQPPPPEEEAPDAGQPPPPECEGEQCLPPPPECDPNGTDPCYIPE